MNREGAVRPQAISNGSLSHWSLTGRVSFFFLTALAVALGGYSLFFYLTARQYVLFKFESETRGVLNSLVAAVEVEDTEVKWQPLEHSINYGDDIEFGDVQWVVIGDAAIVEQSQEVDSEFQGKVAGYLSTEAVSSTLYPSPNEVMVEADGNYCFMVQRLVAPRPMRIARDVDEFDEILVAVGRSTIGRDSVLIRMGVLITVLPVTVWLLAALIGRWFVRQALFPVLDMAQQAQSIKGQDLETRLRYVSAGDELNVLGDAFNSLLDRQKATFEQQQRFAGDAAHELRTPLTVLLGELDVTLRKPRSADEYRSTLQGLRTEVQSLNEIVESLLFLARNDSKSFAPALQRVSLKNWFEQQSVKIYSPDRQADLIFESQVDDQVSVVATTALLSRILDNLVSNAIKYSAPGSNVWIRAKESSQHILIEVEDNGIGISEADKAQLFKPFFRSLDARKRGVQGTGLGLAIASRMAAVLGGEIACRSLDGGGSKFVLMLPRAV